MTIIMPTDKALAQMFPEPAFGEDDPFTTNMPLARQLVTDHIITEVSHYYSDVFKLETQAFQAKIEQKLRA